LHEGTGFAAECFVKKHEEQNENAREEVPHSRVGKTEIPSLDTRHYFSYRCFVAAAF
jgi:hypothetical protein